MILTSTRALSLRDRVSPRAFQPIAILLAVVMTGAISISPATASTLTWGSISQRVGETRGIYDWELQDLIADKIGTASDIVLINTACYGGDFSDNFNGAAGDTAGGAAFDTSAFSNATTVTSNTAGKQTYYDGHHDDAAKATKPGNTTDQVKNAGGKDARETPQSQGPVKTLGGVNSTHILIWDGQPNAKDKADETNIKNNWAGHPNTTVHVLSNNDAAGTTGNTTTGPATRASLEAALTTIGALMAPGEQFIMFVTDHGDLHTVNNAITPTPPTFATPFTIDLPTQILNDMIVAPGNVPTLMLATQQQIIQPELVSLQLVSVNPVTVPLNTAIIGTMLLPGNIPVTTYTIPLLDINFDLSFGPLSPQSFVLTNGNTGGPPIVPVFAEIGSGAIQRPEAVPEPATLALAFVGLGLLGFVGWRRSR